MKTYLKSVVDPNLIMSGGLFDKIRWGGVTMLDIFLYRNDLDLVEFALGKYPNIRISSDNINSLIKYLDTIRKELAINDSDDKYKEFNKIIEILQIAIDKESTEITPDHGKLLFNLMKHEAIKERITAIYKSVMPKIIKANELSERAAVPTTREEFNARIGSFFKRLPVMDPYGADAPSPHCDVASPPPDDDFAHSESECYKLLDSPQSDGDKGNDPKDSSPDKSEAGAPFQNLSSGNKSSRVTAEHSWADAAKPSDKAAQGLSSKAGRSGIPSQPMQSIGLANAVIGGDSRKAQPVKQRGDESQEERAR